MTDTRLLVTRSDLRGHPGPLAVTLTRFDYAVGQFEQLHTFPSGDPNPGRLARFWAGELRRNWGTAAFHLPDYFADSADFGWELVAVRQVEPDAAYHAVVHPRHRASEVVTRLRDEMELAALVHVGVVTD